jgi:hypothetical protein
LWKAHPGEEREPSGTCERRDGSLSDPAQACCREGLTVSLGGPKRKRSGVRVFLDYLVSQAAMLLGRIRIERHQGRSLFPKIFSSAFQKSAYYE